MKKLITSFSIVVLSLMLSVGIVSAYTHTPVDLCKNLIGNQSVIPANMVADNDGNCDCQTGYHQVPVEDNYEGFVDEVEQENFTCEADEPETTPTPTPTDTPPNVGGPGDGRSDGLGCASHDCSNQTSGGQVLGASTGPQVLGLSTTSSGSNSLLNLFQLLGAFTLTVSGFSFFKKNA